MDFEPKSPTYLDPTNFSYDSLSALDHYVQYPQSPFVGIQMACLYFFLFFFPITYHFIFAQYQALQTLLALTLILLTWRATLPTTRRIPPVPIPPLPLLPVPSLQLTVQASLPRVSTI